MQAVGSAVSLRGTGLGYQWKPANSHETRQSEAFVSNMNLCSRQVAMRYSLAAFLLKP